MKVINTYEAKTHLSSLLERAAAGEEIVIGKAGKPMARLVPYAPGADSPPPRTFGDWAGRCSIADNFEDPLPQEIQNAFDGLTP